MEDIFDLPERARLQKARELMDNEEFADALVLLTRLVKGPGAIQDGGLVHETVRLYTGAKLRYNGSRMIEMIPELGRERIALPEFREVLAREGIELDVSQMRSVLEQHILGGVLAARFEGDVLVLE